MRKVNLELIFSGISALSALAGITLAIWAAFFTSLPEKIIEELSEDVQLAKTEKTLLLDRIVELKNNLAGLNLKYDRKLADVEAIGAENEKLGSQVTSLEEKRLSLKLEVEKLKAERVEVRKAILTRFVERFLQTYQSLRNRIAERVEQGASLSEGIDWMAKQPKLDKERLYFFWQDEKALVDSKHYRSALDEWLKDDRAFLYSLYVRNSRYNVWPSEYFDNTEEAKAAAKQKASIEAHLLRENPSAFWIESFSKSIFFSMEESIETGFDLINFALEDAIGLVLDPRLANSVRAAASTFKKNHFDVIGQFLIPQYVKGMGVEEIESLSKETMLAISSVRRLDDQLREQLLAADLD